MNATATRTAPSSTTSTTSTTSTKSVASKPASLWRPGVRAGLIAAAATVAVAACAQAVGVSFETEPGKGIPLPGFAQLTLICTAVGVLIARSIRRRASRPRSTFTRTTVVLTCLSVVPDLLLSLPVASTATLVLTHVVAAAIVIPALASRLPEGQPS